MQKYREWQEKGEKEKHAQVEALLNSGRSYRESGQIQLAIENFQRASKLAKKLKDGKGRNKRIPLFRRSLQIEQSDSTSN